MSPRYRPKTREFADHLDEQARIADAAHDYRVATDAALEQVSREHGITPRVSVRDRGSYGPGSPHSYFRDLAASAAASSHRDWMPHPQHGGFAEARARLDTVETRTLSTTATAGGNFALTFSPTAAPGYIGAAFAAAVRSKARLAQILHHEPLPPAGTRIETTKITTGTSAAIMATENSALSETDVVEALVTSALATIAGQQNMSQQLLDHAAQSSQIDVVLATDLGNAIGSQLDTQILYGTGANGQLRGFANSSPTTTVTKTNASPTGATNLAAIGDLAAQTATAYGAMPDTIIMHGRRLAFVTTKNVGGFRWPVANIVEVPSLHVSDGGSTNADELWALATPEIWLFGGDPSFRVMFDQSGSNTMTVKFVATMYCGLLAHRMPAALGRLTGSEFVAPVF